MIPTPARSLRSHDVRRRAIGTAVAAVVVAACVAGALALTSTRPGYRTAPAQDGTVVKTVAVTGTVEPIDRVTLSFGVAGTIASVAVHVGERVAAGQTLATLTSTALAHQVTQAQASLRAAQAALAADETAEARGGGGAVPASSTTSGSAPSGSAGGSSGPGSGTSGSTPAGTPPTTLHAAQQDVVSAQKTADAAAQAAAQALTTADATCGASSPAPGTGPSTGSSSPSTSTTTTTTTSAARGSGAGTACAEALRAALAAQQALATDQGAVTAAETALAKLLSEIGSSTTGATGTATATTTSPPATTTTATPGGTATGVSPQAATPTTPKGEAAQLASDQATVDSDDATLLTDEQSLAEADLTAPIAGTVGAVNIAAGQTAGLGSQTAAVTILTQHAFEAEGLVTPAQVPQLAMDDTVRITVNGRPTPISGRVTRIGPVDTALGYQYPVVAVLPAGTAGLFTGALCQMTVVVRVVRHTLTVPTSAVHTSHGRPSVTVLQAGRPKRVPVAVGIVGIERTQVLAGLRPGEQVVLADLARALPKPASTPGSQSRTNFPVPFPGGHVTIVGNGNGAVFSYSYSPTA